MLLCVDGDINIVCGGLFSGFVLNIETLRFQQVYGYGYVDDRPINNTPSITAGKCSVL